jgi:hypothetical protein
LNLETDSSANTLARLKAKKLRVEGDELEAVSTAGSFDFALFGTNQYLFHQGAGDNGLYIGLGTVDRTVLSAIKKSAPYAHGGTQYLELRGARVLFNIQNGSLEVAGGTNIRGRIEGSSSSPSVAWMSDRVVIGNAGYNGASPTSGNTQPLWAFSMNAFNAFNNASDERDKKYISTVKTKDAYEMLKNIEIKRYQMKSGDGSWQYGIIAQDIVPVFPDAVSQRDDNGHYMAKYQNLWAIGFAATKQVVEELESLRARVTELESLRSS